MRSRRRVLCCGFLIFSAVASLPAQQAPAKAPPRPAPAAQVNRPFPPDYPEHPPAAPEQVAHGQTLFRSNCSFCHGSDGRGGEKGPNLVRDVVVLRDQNGELITPIVQAGIPAAGMPKFTLSAADIGDIAAWLHAQPLSDRGEPSRLDILVGDAKAGETFFNGAGRCTQCHSTTGDLAGIGGRYEPKMIQNLIVSGAGFFMRRRSAGPAAPKPQPITVTVTLPSGQVMNGELDHISAFIVALRDSTGTYRSFARHDTIPRVVVNIPFQWHIDMLPRWRDADIHNLTAYLVTLK
ncbi:MAG TPA: c-type cytochrome [Gemmatimonadales bacterium]|jgi:mono/diheme cytochrome c family protein